MTGPVRWLAELPPPWIERAAAEGGGGPGVWAVNIAFLLLIGTGLAAGGWILLRLRRTPVAWPARVSRMTWRPWQWEDGLRLAAFLLLLHVAFLAVYRLLYGDAEDGAGQGAFLVVARSVLFHWAALLYALRTTARRRLPWRSAFGLDAERLPLRVGQGLLFYLAALPIVVFYAWVAQIVLVRLGYRPDYQEVMYTLLAENPWPVRCYLVLLAVVIAPVAEELLFRGIALPALTKKIGIRPAVALVSLLFAGLHLHVASFAPLLVIGLAFSLAYLYSESILVPVTMHAVFNGVSLAVLFARHGV